MCTLVSKTNTHINIFDFDNNWLVKATKLFIDGAYLGHGREKIAVMKVIDACLDSFLFCLIPVQWLLSFFVN